MKPQARFLGIDDAPFDKFNDKETFIVATFFRGGDFLDGVLTTKVEVDGEDATIKIIELVKKSKFYPQLQCIMLDGIAVAGFNVINIQAIYRQTKIPVLVIMRDYPELEKIKSALTKLGFEKKLQLLEKAGPIHKVNDIHIQFAGIDLEQAKEILRISCTHSNIPEPVRTAHLIASGIAFGESRGKP